jgi:o-succinylbenzoate synthase
VARPLIAFRIPLRVPFRGVTAREGLLLSGPGGWGELSPFPDYDHLRARRWLDATLEAARGAWPAPVRDAVPVNVTVPAVAPACAHAIVTASGCSTAKVKVAEGDDVARVEAVRDALGPRGRLRIDANGAWDEDAAAAAIRSLARFELEYVEQPVPTLEAMARLRRRVDVPLAADESVRTARDPARVRAAGAADVVVLKAHPLGGVAASLEVAEACGLPVVVSSALETSVGLAAGVALAAALPELPFACGLGTASLLAGDVVAEPLVPVRGRVPVRRPAVDGTALAAHRVDASSSPHLERLASLARAAAGSVA